MAHEELNEIRKMTRRGYAEALEEEKKQPVLEVSVDEKFPSRIPECAADLGYGEKELAILHDKTSVVEGAGNPLAAIEIKPGETVMIIGCRTGADCLLAANATGRTGKVVGVEEAPDEITIAREAVREAGYRNIEIRPGENENLPAADGSFDLVVTNCSLTFSYDKPRVLKEAARVLKKGARMILCEPVLVEEASASNKKAATRIMECLENAISAKEYKRVLKGAGFKKIKAVDETEFPLSRMLQDKRAQACLAKGEVSAADVEAMYGIATCVKIKAMR